MFPDDGHAHVWRAAGYQSQTLVDKADEHAAIVACKIERCVYFKANTQFWKRYVDDTFVIIRQDNLSAFHQLLNTTLPRNQLHDGDSYRKQITFPGCTCA